ncbi:uncharacterized protein LOC100577759 isoform X2 [Apis mellifera]|uniref:Uncharacterized protein LOC100577759 isoform X2 n=1 Tax=Apis mellifera TaxID=7460 RepID=A0A7M7SQG7_APIME|nr:uncharacterized protein LOC100577759 isoform X2 [Apis mellifera]|eukprot:XP_026299003.1 uncharacterized protein LOC100577759 isoform X2 [Apis mellifera]
MEEREAVRLSTAKLLSTNATRITRSANKQGKVNQTSLVNGRQFPADCSTSTSRGFHADRFQIPSRASFALDSRPIIPKDLDERDPFVPRPRQPVTRRMRRQNGFGGIKNKRGRGMELGRRNNEKLFIIDDDEICEIYSENLMSFLGKIFQSTIVSYSPNTKSNFWIKIFLSSRNFDIDL